MTRQTAVPEPPAFYRDILLQNRQDVLSSLGLTFDCLAQFGRVAEEDQAKITHDEFVSLRLNRLEYQKLRLVNEALDRLDAGEYGVCEKCEEPIHAKRLRALPWAKYCIRCQEAGTHVEDEPPPELDRRRID